MSDAGPERDHSILGMTDDEIRTAYGNITVRQLRELEETLEPEERERLLDVVTPNWRANQAAILDAVRKVPKFSTFLPKIDTSSITAWKHAVDSARQTSEVLERLQEPVVIAPIPLEVRHPEVPLLERLLEAHRAQASATQAAAEAQLQEARDAAKRARLTHRVTRAASVAGIMAGPLALYASARASDAPWDQLIMVGVIWLLGPIIAWFAERPPTREDRQALEE